MTTVALVSASGTTLPLMSAIEGAPDMSQT